MLAVEELLRIPTENESMEYYAKVSLLGNFETVTGGEFVSDGR